MSKLTFGAMEIKKDRSYCYKSRIFKKYVDIENVLVSHQFSSGEKTIYTLLVTCMTVIKLRNSEVVV